MSKSKRPGSKRPILSDDDESLAVTHPHAAGIDIGARELWVAVPPKAVPTGESVRSFSTFTKGLHEMADWLQKCGVKTVALESTGVYWIPVYEILEDRGIEPWLVNSFESKSVPGRKTDAADCQWLRDLHKHGLLRRSFRPTGEFVEFRQYLRLRNARVETAADAVRRMQKALTLMNVHLHLVVSDITGKTGMAIIRAILSGERDPKVLAQNRQPGCRRSLDEIEAALCGNYQLEHLFALQQELEVHDLAHRQIEECDQRAEQLLIRLQATIAPTAAPPPKKKAKPKAHAATVDFASRLMPILGVDLTAVPGLSDYSAAALIGEVGSDMTRWPTAHHFASWLRLCPGADITGGKVKSTRHLPTTNRATSILRMAAVNAGRTSTALGAFYRSLASRKGKQQAVVATARKISVTVYTMMRNQVPYQDPGATGWDQRRIQRERKLLEKRARQLGYTVVAPNSEVPVGPS